MKTLQTGRFIHKHRKNLHFSSFTFTHITVIRDDISICFIIVFKGEGGNNCLTFSLSFANVCIYYSIVVLCCSSLKKSP